MNEGSPYAVFTVDGAPGQLVSLALTGGYYDIKIECSSDGGKTWTPYSGGGIRYITAPTAPIGTDGTLLVRVPITNNQVNDPDKVYKLNVFNSAGKAFSGTATIQDDGNGTIFNADGSVNNTATKDNDGAANVTVTSTKINEGSTDPRDIVSPPPEAVFVVTGKPNQQISLSLIGGSAVSADSGPPIEYSTDGGINWTPYSGGKIFLSDNEGALLVSVPIASESVKEPNEAFKLQVTTDGDISYGTATLQKPGLVRL